MLTTLASSYSRQSHALNSLPGLLGNASAVQVRNAGGVANRQAAAAARNTKQRAFRMKKEKSGPPPKPQPDGIGAFQPMPPNRLQNPLFNPEARTVLDLPTFHPEVLTETLALNKAMAFGAAENAPMRTYGIPRNVYVDFRLLSRPCSVVRDVTLRLIDRLEKPLKQSSSLNQSSFNHRMVLTGPPGCGKSFLLLQAVEYCKSVGYIVLYIPRASKVVDSSVPYTYDTRTRMYTQPTYACQLLQRFLKVNVGSLQQLKTNKDFIADDSTRLPQGSSMPELINIGIRDQTLVTAVLTAVFEELAAQKTFPILLAIDDFQSLFCHTTSYRNPQFQGIKPYHMSVPRLLLEYTSRRKSFERGAVIGAISGTNTNYPITLELQKALGLPTPRPVNQYSERSSELADYARNLENFQVPDQLSLDEAASLFEVWSKDRALHTVADDELFLAKYTEASGNARGFVRTGLLHTMTT